MRVRGVLRGLYSEDAEASLHRCQLPLGWVAISSRLADGTVTVSLDRHVKDCDVAAALRHVLIRHSGSALAWCATETCTAATRWRVPTAEAAVIAAGAEKCPATAG